MIIIPDIHGRSFWKDAVKENEDQEFIFLGDYVDPYSHEGIMPWEGLDALEDVIEFKKSHPDNVTLLLGNHDLTYLSESIGANRHDYERQEEITALLEENIDLFQIACEKVLNGKRYIFSHAGIIRKWLRNNEATLGTIIPGHEVETLNRLFHEGKLYPALSDVSYYRGGPNDTSSCVWADIEEFVDHLRSDAPISTDVYQIFAHTQVGSVPFTCDFFACVDCKRAFNLDDEGNFIAIS